MKSRIFNILQYEKHPDTGEPLLNEDQIKLALSHKTIKRWAYIAHDKDHYSDADFDDNPNHTVDMVKPKHWHIVLETSQNAMDSLTIAKWFKIPENFVDCPKGAGAFLDCVEYLTHEDARQNELLDKYRYPDEEIKANFNFREELDKRAERLIRYGKDMDERGAMRYDILYKGMTLNQAFKRNREVLSQFYSEMTKARSLYLEHMPVPDTRINFYVWSKRGGDGKGLASRALARSLYPDMEDDEIFFNFNKDTRFNGYDGQPVIIWNDFRAGDLLSTLGGRGAVFDVFDTHPVKQSMDVKYSKTTLVNRYNIVNSVQPYTEFLDNLAGEYKDKNGNFYAVEDKSQSYRRFPLIIEVRPDEYDYYVNKGFIGNNRSYLEYEGHKNLSASLRRLHQVLEGKEILVRELERQAMKPIVAELDRIETKVNSGELTDEDARALFKDLGTPINKLLGTELEFAEDVKDKTDKLDWDAIADELDWDKE